MKKIITIILFGAGILLAPRATAATIDISSIAGKCNIGDSLSVRINVDPKGVDIFTVKTSIEYPAELVSLESFSFNSGWMPLSQTGYDLVDNVNGKLIKTAGYPGGAKNLVNFGTATFRCNNEGIVTVKTGTDSFILGSDNSNLLQGSSSISISINKKIVETKPQIVQQESKEIIDDTAPKSTQAIDVSNIRKINPIAYMAAIIFASLNPIITSGIAISSLISVLVINRSKRN